MDNPQVEQFIAQLKSEDAEVSRSAANALGEIGDGTAIAALIAALPEVDNYVVGTVGRALVKIGSLAIPALIQAWLEEHTGTPPHYFANILGAIGDVAAVPVLIEKLADRDHRVRYASASALREIGDSEALPGKILADTRLSAQERIGLLEQLRRIHYRGSRGKGASLSLRYAFPDTRSMCQTVLTEEDAEARKGAQAVLNWLDSKHLLRGSQPDTSKQAGELLRPVKEGEPETRPETLLRAGHEPEEDGEAVAKQPTIWQRILGKRKAAS